MPWPSASAAASSPDRLLSVREAQAGPALATDLGFSIGSYVFPTAGKSLNRGMPPGVEKIKL